MLGNSHYEYFYRFVSMLKKQNHFLRFVQTVLCCLAVCDRLFVSFRCFSWNNQVVLLHVRSFSSCQNMYFGRIFIVEAVLLSSAMLIVQCAKLSQTELERIIGTCGTSPNQPFDGRADAAVQEFPWNAQLFFAFGECHDKYQ